MTSVVRHSGCLARISGPLALIPQTAKTESLAGGGQFVHYPSQIKASSSDASSWVLHLPGGEHTIARSPPPPPAAPPPAPGDAGAYAGIHLNAVDDKGPSGCSNWDAALGCFHHRG